MALTNLHASNDLKLGIIGLDTSHAVAFTKILNDPDNPHHVKGAKVVAAFKGGSPDIPSSRDRVDRYTKTLVEDFGVKLYPTIEAMCGKVDAVLLESVDGRPHLKQAKPVIEAGLPLFIDKPVAGSLKDAIAIFDLAQSGGSDVHLIVAAFRKGNSRRTRGSIGKVTMRRIPPVRWSLTIQISSGMEFMGGISLYGLGIWASRSGVGRPRTEKSGNGQMDGRSNRGLSGRQGLWRKGRGQQGRVRSGNSTVTPLIREIVTFLGIGDAPVTPEESIAIYAFMEAADESKRRGGEEVSLEK